MSTLEFIFINVMFSLIIIIPSILILSHTL